MVRTIAFLFWLFLLALSVPYVRRVKHPETQTLAAALMFVMLVSVISGSLFFALGWAAISLGWAHALADPLWAVVFVAVVFLPGLLFARWMIRRPPWNRPVPK
jgi:hypothetical protein